MCNLTDSSKVLMKNNIMIKAKYNISTIENRIFQMILYKLQRKNDDVLSCDISYSEFKSLIKNRNKATVESICNILKKLRSSSVFLKKDKKWAEFGFINGYIYDEDTNIFTIQGSNIMYSFLREYLNTGYTPINLHIFLGLKNSYAQRFYEFLRLWSNKKSKITYSIEELKGFLLLEDKYSRYPDFKRRIIVPAIKELNSTGFFEIEFKEIKAGKKVISIEFLVKDLDKRIYFNELESLDDIGVSEENIIDIDDKKIKSIENKKGVEDILNIQNKSIIKRINNSVKDYDLYEYEDIVWDAEIATLEKDDNKYDCINGSNYKYFITTLLNKLELANLEDVKEFNI